MAPGDLCRQLERELAAEKAKSADMVDTIAAIYERLGIKERDVDGKEMVSVTVKRYVDQLTARNQRLVEALSELAERTFEECEFGYLEDGAGAECTCCGGKGASREDIAHEKDCFQKYLSDAKALTEPADAKGKWGSEG